MAEIDDALLARLDALIEQKLVRERLFREDFTHRIKSEIITRITRLTEGANPTPSPPANKYIDKIMDKKSKFRYEFAVLSKSFRRDLGRTINSYQSFENFFEASDKIPYYIVVPDEDLNLFSDALEAGRRDGKIKKIPELMAESTVFELAGEPLRGCLAMGGYYSQQVVKLCFSMTGLARDYLIVDPDGYFIRTLDKEYFLDVGKVKLVVHEIWQSGYTRDELDQAAELGHSDKNLESLAVKFLDSAALIKSIIGSNSGIFRNYIASPNIFNSEILRALRSLLVARGIPNFGQAITTVPFEFQWYGEFLNMIGNFEMLPYIFHVVDPKLVTVKMTRKTLGAPGKFGIQYQSIDYSSGGLENKRVAPIIEIVDTEL